MKKIFTKNMEKRPMLTFVIIMLLYFIVMMWPAIIAILTQSGVWAFIEIAWVIVITVLCFVFTKD